MTNSVFCVPVEKYRKCEPLSASGDTKAVDPLVNLDSKTIKHLLCHACPVYLGLSTLFNVAGSSPDFKAGVTALANILKIQRHDDYLVMLKVGVGSHPQSYFKLRPLFIQYLKIY